MVHGPSPAVAKSVFLSEKQMNVLFEAVIVGLILIPVYLVAETLFRSYGKFVVVFAAGALFHLAAEVTGINKAYVKTKLM